MKNKTIMLSTAIVAAIILAGSAFVLLNLTPATGDLPPGEPPEWQIQITGNVAQEETWTLKDITQLPLTNVTNIINGENATYLGVPFYDFCNQTTKQWDSGEIEIISVDGTKASINIFHAYNSSAYPYYYTNNVVTLAFAKNGKWLTTETGGPLKLVVPYSGDEYQVETIAEICFNPWTISISGEVETPLTISNSNLASFPSKTVYAEFAPSEKRWANWTGLPILEILEAANVSSRAEKITITAVDGYVKNYTLDQVREGQMMIGYAENDCPLSHPEGGPFRLFAPTEKYKWAQFWVKFVCDIKVS
jgi:DMSO/TMAO reductase YedYZ molybdopterin-dependent catalytic subunit